MNLINTFELLDHMEHDETVALRCFQQTPLDPTAKMTEVDRLRLERECLKNIHRIKMARNYTKASQNVVALWTTYHPGLA
jgi:hypothetical protein